MARTLRTVLSCLIAALLAVAGSARAALIFPDVVDGIDGTGAGTFSGALSPSTDHADWYSFQTTSAGAAVSIQILSESFDARLRLWAKGSPIVPGDLLNPGFPGSLAMVDEDVASGPGGLALIENALGGPTYWAVSVEDTLSGGGAYTLQIAAIGTLLPVPGDAAQGSVPLPGTAVLLLAALLSVAMWGNLRRRSEVSARARDVRRSRPCARESGAAPRSATGGAPRAAA